MDIQVIADCSERRLSSTRLSEGRAKTRHKFRVLRREVLDGAERTFAVLRKMRRT